VNTKNLIPGTEDIHKEWPPVLELATQEVFETMLACSLTAAAIPSTDALNVTTMVGLAGDVVRSDERPL
jgi:hypothetical protein